MLSDFFHKGAIMERIDASGRRNSVRWLTWALFMLLIIGLCMVHEPWGDEHHVLDMVHRMSKRRLIAVMSKEGHFCMWHLCIWPLVKWFHMDYHALFVASVSLMSLAVWLMLFKLDFPFLAKLLIIFSSPFFYKFAVIARCYALIPPVLVALAVVYQRRNNPFLYCFLIGVLAHTHAYMEGMVAVLWCCFVYEYVYLPYRQNEVERVRRNLWASLITVAMVILAFAQIAHGIVDAAHGEGVAMNRVSDTATWLLYVYENHHVLDLSLTLACYCAIIIMTYLCVKESKSRSAAWIIIVSIVFQILFAFHIYMMDHQRVFLLYLPILYVLWIIYRPEQKKRVVWIVFCFWLLNTSSQNQFIRDIHEEYSYDLSAAKDLQASITEDIPIVAHTIYCMRSVNLLQQDINFVSRKPLTECYDVHFLEERYPELTDFYFIAYDLFIPDSDAEWNVDLLCKTKEGKYEFTRGEERILFLYRITKHHEQNIN